MRALLVSAAAIAIGVLLLFVFYRAIKTEWPENYVTASGDFGVIVNRSLVKYSAFRLVPVYAVALLVSESSARYGGRPFYVALGVGILHVAATNLRHLYFVLRRPRGHTRTATILVHLVTSIGVLLAAFLAALGTGPFTAVVPPIDEFFKSFWTTAVVVLLAVYIASLSTAKRTPDVLVRKSRIELNDLTAYARNEARSAGVNEDLVEAVLLTENLERPAWVRSFERLKGRVFPAGTYGVMQATASAPISDRESVKRGIARLSETPLKVDRWGYPEDESLDRTLRAYNNDESFRQLAREIFYHIRAQGTPSATIADDSHPKEPEGGERVRLAAEIYGELSIRLGSIEGLTSLARTSIDDLRELADIVRRLPPFESPEAIALRSRLQTALSELDSDQTDKRDLDETQGRASGYSTSPPANRTS